MTIRLASIYNAYIQKNDYFIRINLKEWFAKFRYRNNRLIYLLKSFETVPKEY